jgi:uncharacterized protein YrrD
MQFKEGTHVYAAGGDDVGRIDRVVIDPRTKEVSHVVVRKGFLFTEDKVVPINLIAQATDERVTLRQDAGDLENLPPFEETQYVPIDEEDRATFAPVGYAAPLYWYPTYGGVGWYGGASYPMYPNVAYPTHTEKNIPEGTVGLKEGARVVTASGEHVGSVERIFTQDDRVTHILVSQGVIFKEKKLVPMGWIVDVKEDEVTLGVRTGVLERLPAFEE